MKFKQFFKQDRSKKISIILVLCTTLLIALTIFRYHKPTTDSSAVPATLKAVDSIIEINTLHPVLEHADRNSLVIFDIDLTLLNIGLEDKEGNVLPLIYEKEDAFNYILANSIDKHLTAIQQQLFDRGIPTDQAPIIKALLTKFLALKISDHMNYLFRTYILPRMKVVPYDVAVDIVNQLQAKGIRLMAFTARSWKLKDRTQNELKSAGFHLDKNTVYASQITQDPRPSRHGFGYEQGILQLIPNPKIKENLKGPTLLSFFKAIDYTPHKVIFIDSKEQNVISVVEALKGAGIPVVGFWYKAQPKPKGLSQTYLDLFDYYLDPGWRFVDIDRNEAAEFIANSLKNRLK